MMWALLVELDRHNRAVASGGVGSSVRRVLMTGFGTGVGKISATRCAQQMSLAVKHFVDACANPDKWSSLEWDGASSYADEVKETHVL